MQKCLKCNTTFEKKQIRNSIFSFSSGYQDIKCNHCGEVHKVRFQTRIVTTLFVTSPLIAKLIFGYAIPGTIILPAFIISFISTVYFVPYFAWYKLKKIKKATKVKS